MYVPLFADTDQRAEEVLLDLARKMSAAEKAPEEMRKRLCALLHGREISLQVFGWDPDREGY